MSKAKKVDPQLAAIDKVLEPHFELLVSLIVSELSHYYIYLFMTGDKNLKLPQRPFMSYMRKLEKRVKAKESELDKKKLPKVNVEGIKSKYRGSLPSWNRRVTTSSVPLLNNHKEEIIALLQAGFKRKFLAEVLPKELGIKASEWQILNFIAAECEPEVDTEVPELSSSIVHKLSALKGRSALKRSPLYPHFNYIMKLDQKGVSCPQIMSKLKTVKKLEVTRGGVHTFVVKARGIVEHEMLAREERKAS